MRSTRTKISAGEKHGKWTAVKYDKIDNAGNVRWIFNCDCGTETSLPASIVVCGRSRSCVYCKHSKDLKGKKFGKWKVLEKLPRLPEYSHNHWLCICECGNKVSVDQSNLVNGISKQCNNCRIKVKSKSPIPIKFWAKFMYNAGRRKIDWNLKEEEAWDVWLKQKGKCKFTGLSLSFGGENGASIDRIDSSKGYEKDNVQWVHKKINFMKFTFTNNEFIRMCNLVSENYTND